ncbi:MAG: DUF2400 family protein, partial [Deltaproteobacteria bacterium]|nr:DUF2400 family protein [Deltaproteobacteria bacterium]
MVILNPADIKKLKTLLDRLYRTFNLEYLSPDPLEFVHRFKEPSDIEATGIVASALAYGRVETIRQSIGRVMDVMDWSPHGFILN